MRSQRLPVAFLAATLGACSSASRHGSGPTEHEGGMPHHHHGFTDANAWTKVFDDPARDAWQRPDDVIRALDLTPAMTVADIGAGTGYFTVRLARAVPEGAVIATDVEPNMVRFLEERAQREHLANIRAIQTPANASGLAAHSVDRILIVDVWHHLADRVAYARELAAALRPGGKLFIVDFMLAAQHGPPADMRIAPEALIAELARAGLQATVSPVALPDQYIIEARAR